MTDKLTTKQIAKNYYIDDIVVHELILEAIDQLKDQSERMTKYDAVYKICELAINNKMFQAFNIDKYKVLKTVQDEYNIEIDTLVQN
jgi:hypothetical protein